MYTRRFESMDCSQVILATPTHALLVHGNGVSANSSSPSTTFDPLTPSSLHPVDIADFIDDKVLMSPPLRPNLPHAATYTYGTDGYAGLSSEYVESWALLMSGGPLLH